MLLEYIMDLKMDLKPSHANLFLKPFIEEARNLTINGLYIMINGHTYP